MGWVGREKTTEEEAADVTNVGDFALVQLIPSHIVGPRSEPWIFSTLWEVEPRMKDDGMTVEMQKVERGPIFSRYGTVNYDWDPLFMTPVYIANLGQFGFTKQRVLNGEFLFYLPNWFSSAKKKLKQSVEDKYKAHKSELDSRSREMTDYWWSLGNRTGETTYLTTREERIAAMKALYKRQEQRNLSSGAYRLKDAL